MTADKMLKDCRVLVVEDEYMLADELAIELQDAGATVSGPVGTLGDAIAGVAADTHIDGVNLGGNVFPVAEMLLERGVPFVLTMGYDLSALPARFEHIVRCEKPISIKRVPQAIGRVIHP